MDARKAENEVRKVVKRLTSVRRERGVSHEKLAEKTGLSRAGISTIESGKTSPTLKSCLRICEGLDVKLSDILRETGQ